MNKLPASFRNRTVSPSPCAVLCSVLALLFGIVARTKANPTGMTVSGGNATAAQSGSQLTVTASQNAFLNWQSFNIGKGETTTFVQPSAGSVVWNRINDSNPSQIFGNLNANGTVVLMNSSGFYFGPDSVIKAAGFVATTAMPPADFGGGGQWEFSGPPPTVPIINYGQVKVANGGSLFLISDAIENHGTLEAPNGKIGLYSGKEVLISNSPDGRGVSASVTLPAGSVNNYGVLNADGGTILVHARTVNQDGIVQANSVQEKNGVIELVASDSLNLGENSVIEAHGDDSAAASDGGQITVKSDNVFTDAAGSRISVAGGDNGGNGGWTEISAPSMSDIFSTVDGHAANGVGGQLLLDPNNITIGSSGTGSAGSGTVNSGDAPASGTLTLNANTAFVGFSQIDLQARNNITVSGVNWDLNASTGISAPGSLLKLEAGANITIGNGASIIGGTGWSVTMQAGRDFLSPNAVNSGVGNIIFTGSGAIQTMDGSINLLAGNNITVNSGYVRTMGGGSISATALAGSVNSGTKANGYAYLPSGIGYAVDPNLGGISTGAGGDVNISAGLDITGFLPIGGASGATTEAGSGAFGPQAGNVTLTAGGNITGHFAVANGTGIINAGQSAGTTSRQLALSLVSGGWTVNAVQDILLQEVRNPNGIFNSLGLSTSTTKHRFNYSPDAYVNLNGGNSVQLLGLNVPRNSNIFEQGIPSIYAPTLNIAAGAGGVQIANNLILFPSPIGQLNITTTGGGSLNGTKSGDFVQITMSDSSAVQFKNTDSFSATDHASTPIHLNDPTPVTLDIAGDMNNILLTAPKATDVNVGGNMNNSRLNIQNLHPTDVSTLNVSGNIVNRNEFTSVTLATAPDFTDFLFAYELPASLATLPNQFHYDPLTHTLTFQGRMSSQQLQTLLNLQIQPIDPLTQLPAVDLLGNPILSTVSILDSVTALALYNGSQNVPLNPDSGYIIAGPGKFNLNAHNLDLGDTLGVRSVGPGFNAALASLGSSGAAININLSGNLDMFSTTISTIAGGDIAINALGNINVGSAAFFGNDQYARGIFTVAKSDVSVTAAGDINVSGSRIAVYDGGNITVRSLHGNVDAGSGGQGLASVTEVIVDPLTGQVKNYTSTIPGSGILATTFPPSLDPTFPNSHNAVGNILVETPQGNIIANAGGVLQLPLNGVRSADSTITLIAGSRDAQGNVLYDGKIDASGSGIIGANVSLDATAGITGLVIAQGNLNLNSGQNINVTAVAGGNATVSASGTISGSIVGVGSVSASGSSVDASLLSQNVSTSGSVSGSVGFAQANVAGAASTSASSDDTAAKSDAAVESDSEDDKKNKKLPTVTKTGRVTVILPKKS